MSEDKFFCPVYNGLVTKYDCNEISFGIKSGFYLNDGLSPLVPIEIALRKRYLCNVCQHNANKDCNIKVKKTSKTNDTDTKKTEPEVREKMSEEEKRRRLSIRAMEYLMFLDDDE